MSVAPDTERLVVTPPGSPGPWWREMVLYENHLPSFRDGNGDGIGDLPGLIASLDYLAATLGVNAVWVGPFYRSPLLDQGYDVTDHREVDPVFGTLADFDQLVAEAHARNIRVIVDFIPNHTSDQHAWFVESRSSRHNPKRDWYIWADARNGRHYPNNWLSEVSGSAWEWDPRTAQFYLHSHLKEQPDLNWRNPDVRAAQLGVLNYWLDRGVDGFRIDVAHMLMKDPQLRNNPPNPSPVVNPYELQPQEFFTQLHVNDRMHPDLHGALRDIRHVLDAYGGERVAIGEIEAMEWEEWSTFYGAQLDELQLPFAFHLIETPWDARALARRVGELEAAVPSGGWAMIALGNHDRRRLATRLGGPQARVAAVLLLTMRGSPTILYGDELGMADQDVPIERQRDQFGRVGGVCHDPARTPMPWTAGKNGGFSAADAECLWLPVSNDYERINVQAQLADADSILNLYRRLLTLRKQSAALRVGAWRLHDASNEHCLVYVRSADGDRKIVVLNLTHERQSVRITEHGRVVVSTHRQSEGEELDANELSLCGDEGLVIDTYSQRPG